MKELIIGIIIGGVFGILKLDVPAPQTIGGILGIAGLSLGYYLLK